MKLLIQVVFFIYLLSWLIRGAHLQGKYPRVKTYSQGEDTVALVEFTIFLVWTGYYAWGT